MRGNERFRLREAIVCERRHEYVICVANRERGMRFVVWGNINDTTHAYFMLQFSNDSVVFFRVVTVAVGAGMKLKLWLRWIQKVVELRDTARTTDVTIMSNKVSDKDHQKV